MIAVDHFGFRIFDWRQLLHTPIVVNHVQVSGLSIHLPPKDQRANMPHVGGHGSGKIDILVRVIDVDQADLVIENGKPGKVPLDFVINKLRLQSVGAGRPMALSRHPHQSQAHRQHRLHRRLRPLQCRKPRRYPGRWHLLLQPRRPQHHQRHRRHARLHGKYQGQLDHIVVDGKTTTPNFSLDIANRPVPLNTTFHAIVDGTNGDTYLQPVDAWLLHSHIVAQGQVVRVPGVQGRDIRLDVTVDPGHIDDMLLLAVKDQAPIMTGQLQLHTKFDLPPGPTAVLDKLRLQGTFTLTGVHFTTDKIQSKVDELSLRGQGKAKQANEEGQAMKDEKQNNASANGSSSGNGSSSQSQNQNQAATADIASEMRGNFTFADGKITLPALNYRVPGADIAMHGVYNLHDQSLDFSGQARLDAHISQMVTGWKSWLLKPVDPFFAKDGAGTQVPIKVGGTTSHPDIGLDFHHKARTRTRTTSARTVSQASGR